MKKLSFLALAFLLTGVVYLLAADLTGDWEYTMTTQRGPMTQQMKLVQDGEKLAVTMISQRGGESKGEGTVKGSDIEWKIKRTGRDGQEMTITYKGKIVDDNTLQGTMEGFMGGGTPMEWKAVRKPK